MKTLVVSDGKKGHLNQSLAFGELLGGTAQVLEVRPLPGIWEPASRFCSRVLPPARYPRSWTSRVLRNAFGSVEPVEADDIDSSGSALVISAGTTAAIPALALARHVEGRTLHILGPTFVPPRLFNVLVLLQHDVRSRTPRNVLTLPVALGPTGGRALKDSLGEIRRRTGRKQLPAGEFLALLIGGDSTHRKMLPESVLKEVRSVVSLARERGMQILLTTSRRTPATIEQALSELSRREKDSFFLCVWGRSDEYNPVPAFLELAKAVMVTDDSVSMTSEAILMGHRPLIFPLEQAGGSQKLERFHRYLYERDLAQPLQKLGDSRKLWESAVARQRFDRNEVYNAIGLPKLLNRARELLNLEVVSKYGHSAGT